MTSAGQRPPIPPELSMSERSSCKGTLHLAVLAVPEQSVSVWAARLYT
jgi:hypothetical protein